MRALELSTLDINTATATTAAAVSGSGSTPISTQASYHPQIHSGAHPSGINNRDRSEDKSSIDYGKIVMITVCYFFFFYLCD